MFFARRVSYLSLALGAALALPAVPAGADVLRSLLGYTVTVPQGWQTKHEVESHKEGTSTDMMYTHPANAFPLFRVEVDPQRHATMQNAEAMQAAFVQQTVPGFRVMGQRLRRVAGSPASETAAVGPYQGQTVVMDMIYTIHAGRIYTFTLMSTPKAIKPDDATFERILSTLKWTPAK